MSTLDHERHVSCPNQPCACPLRAQERPKRLNAVNCRLGPIATFCATTSRRLFDHLVGTQE